MFPAILLAMQIAGVAAPKGSEPVLIYVGPTVKDGFVETENNVLESVGHIREELQKELRTDPAFRLVSEESGATVKLYIKRSVGFSSTGYEGSVTGGGRTTTGRVSESVTEYGVLDAELRVGSYKKQFNVAVDGWKKLAKQISKDVATWLRANRDRMP